MPDYQKYLDRIHEADEARAQERETREKPYSLIIKPIMDFGKFLNENDANISIEYIFTMSEGGWCKITDKKVPSSPKKLTCDLREDSTTGACVWTIKSDNGWSVTGTLHPKGTPSEENKYETIYNHITEDIIKGRKNCKG